MLIAVPLSATTLDIAPAGCGAGDKPRRQRFKRYPIGFLHMDISEVQTVEGKLYLFVAIDRTGKFTLARLVNKVSRSTGGSR